MGHELGAGLRVAVRIVAVELLILPEGVIREIRVLIDLIGRHVQEGLHLLRMLRIVATDRLEDVHGAHDVRLEGLPRIEVGGADDRLCRKMQHDLGTRGLHEGAEMRKITDVADLRVHLL